MRRGSENSTLRVGPVRLVAAALVFALTVGLVGMVLLGLPQDLLPRWLVMPSVASIEASILELGIWGVAGSIALMILHSFVPFPAELLVIANGMIFGPVLGIVVTWIGAMLGAVAAFGLARLLGRPFVARFVHAEKWRRFDAWLARDGWQVLLLARLAPVVAFNLVNYVAGLTAIRFWTFFWTTAIGILPATVIMVLVGHRIEQLQWWAWLALLAAVLASFLWIRHRWQRSGLS